MADATLRPPPSHCPACATELVVSRLQCPACGTEVVGRFAQGRLVNLPEPHASLLELFLRVRGNAKEMERELGLSYPTVRARLDEAFTAAGLARAAEVGTPPDDDRARQRSEILDALERREIDVAEAATRLRALSVRPPR
jgi:hypothetical protein